MSARIIKSPIFLTGWLCITAFGLSYFISGEDWLWAALFGAMVILDVVELVKAIRKYKGRARAIQIATCGNTFASVFCAGMAWYTFSLDQAWQGWINSTLMVINIWIVFRQQKTLQQIRETDAEFQRWMAEHFPEGQDRGRE